MTTRRTYPAAVKTICGEHPVFTPTPTGAYPPGWPSCPACARPALDGHITCGEASCDEGAWRCAGG